MDWKEYQCLFTSFDAEQILHQLLLIHIFCTYLQFFVNKVLIKFFIWLRACLKLVEYLQSNIKE
jgi:hypothetical protein